jgi:antitoxin FitA
MHADASMRSLQIRDLPEDVYEALSFRAKRNRRSLAQQAIVELWNVTELRRAEDRKEIVRLLWRKVEEGTRRVEPAPEELLREDRDR